MILLFRKLLMFVDQKAQTFRYRLLITIKITTNPTQIQHFQGKARLKHKFVTYRNYLIN